MRQRYYWMILSLGVGCLIASMLTAHTKWCFPLSLAAIVIIYGVFLYANVRSLDVTGFGFFKEEKKDGNT